MPPREPELYKDKVEVSLDGRQIFYLFFGGAVIVGLVFVLGVLVGRRVEARGHLDRAKTHTATDPLAALDRLESNGQLSFRASLAAGKAQPTQVEQEIAKRAEAKATTPAKSDKSEKAVRTEEPAKSEKSEKAAKTEEPAKSDKSEKAVKSDEPAKSDKIEKATKADETEKTAKTEKTEKTEKSEKSEEAKESKSKYTIQLSSFQDKAEADAFLDSVKAQGYSARITQAEVDGKGTFYRVRMGTYSSMDAANEAKSEFEKTAKKTASVMRL